MVDINRKTTPRAVIESPLSGDFVRNKRYALLCCQYCLFELGMAPYASHLFFPQFLDDQNPTHRDLGIEAGFCFVRDAEYRLFFVDLGMSSGMLRGEEDAKVLGQKIQKHQLPKEYMDMLDSDAPIGTPTVGF